jgi:hypothetical protein
VAEPHFGWVTTGPRLDLKKNPLIYIFLEKIYIYIENKSFFFLKKEIQFLPQTNSAPALDDITFFFVQAKYIKETCRIRAAETWSQ